MITRITKRDGRTMPFSVQKITDAISKAAASVGGKDLTECTRLADLVCDRLSENIVGRNPTVEEVQDMVETVLIDEGHAKTAKSYILYRAERTRIRDMNTDLMKTYEDLTFKSAADNDVKRENANINGDTAMGTMLKYGSEGAKMFNEMYVLDKKTANAHHNGDIHIHDFDFYTLTSTCTQIDLLKLFKNGFSTGHGVLREPNGIGSYAALACIAIQSNQNDQHGGQSVPNFDYSMAEGVKKTFVTNYLMDIARAVYAKYKPDMAYPEVLQIVKDVSKQIRENNNLIPRLEADNSIYMQLELQLLLKALQLKGIPVTKDILAEYQHTAEDIAESETDRQTYQAMEALVHNLNTMNSRAGAQVPFSSLNYGTDTSPEGRMAIKNLLLATEAGLGSGETPIFPVQIFKVKEGVNFNPEDPNYDIFKLAMRCSAKRMFPNFSFIDAPFNLQYYEPGNWNTEISYMGCRTRVMGNVHDPSREVTSGRGNLSFTTINLPRLGIEAHGDINKFYKSLDEMMDLVVAQLLARFKIQCQKRVYNYPFLMGQGVWIDSDKLAPEDSVAEVLKHGTLSMGFIGLAETLVALIGKHHGESEEAQKLGLEIVTYMRKRMDAESQKHKLNFTLLATPAEGLSGRFIRIDTARYGKIAGITDKTYYTNSFHVPVYQNISVMKKVELEAPYHALTNAGHITYVELDGDPTQNLKAFETIVRYMKEKGIGYGAINHPIDRDPYCGYTGIINDVCPCCGRREHEVIEERVPRIKI